mgnify:CR=1 FL=1
MKTDLSEKLRADGVEALLQPFSKEPGNWNAEQMGEGGGQTRRCRSRRCVCRRVGDGSDGFGVLRYGSVSGTLCFPELARRFHL